jgi:hypothetical protein
VSTTRAADRRYLDTSINGTLLNETGTIMAAPR